MKVSVDQETCTSCGLCVDTCPEMFEWDTNDKAKAKSREVPPELEDAVREASQGCPVEAISIEE